MLAAAGLSYGQFFVAWAIAGAAATGVFLDATKRGDRHATAWGAGVFLFLIVALPFYLLRRRRAPTQRRRY
jgi:hypothetical protein